MGFFVSFYGFYGLGFLGFRWVLGLRIFCGSGFVGFRVFRISCFQGLGGSMVFIGFW